jgi:hypothetical protein
MALSELEPPSPEVTKCEVAHVKEMEKCGDAYNAAIRGVVTDYRELIKLNLEQLPDSSKKMVCCGFYAFEVCGLKAVSPTTGCEKLFGDYLKKIESDPVVVKTCTKFAKGSTACA